MPRQVPSAAENARPPSEDLPELDALERESRADRRRMRVAVAAAAAVHVALLATRIAVLDAAPPAAPARPEAFIVRPVRFEPPQADPVPEIPRETIRSIPIPDPEPDDPEPIRGPEPPEPPRLDAPALDPWLDVTPPPEPDPDRPLPVGGPVRPPVRISGARPAYTEAACRARIQGVVVVRAVIDREGRVTELEVLAGLPMGLTDSVLEALRGWRFAPGTLHGEPVPVVYDLTVRFGLS